MVTDGAPLADRRGVSQHMFVPTIIAQKAASMSPAAVHLTKAGLAAMFSFSLAELTTGQAVLAAVFAFLSAVLAAYLASRPALMQARVAREQLHNTEAAQTHAARVEFLEERIRYNSQVLVLTRESKRNLLNYAQELTSHVHKLRELLKAKELEAPPFTFKTYEDLCGEEDRALVRLTLPAEVRESQGVKG